MEKVHNTKPKPFRQWTKWLDKDTPVAVSWKCDWKKHSALAVPAEKEFAVTQEAKQTSEENGVVM